MSYTNGILNHVDSQGQGQRGLPGIGFKLDSRKAQEIMGRPEKARLLTIRLVPCDLC